DVGLTGLPNAGKSTLLAALTSARPKIADYPFTTLVPNLGVARFDDRELVVADIPGLIEGASRGLGLGEEFLRHVERTRLLVHVVDAARPDPLADIATIDAELAAYGHGLAERPRIFALNKRDLPEAAAALPALEAALRSTGREPIAISAATRAGVLDLERRIFTLCPPRPAPAATTVSERRIAFAGGAQDFHVGRERDGGARGDPARSRPVRARQTLSAQRARAAGGRGGPPRHARGRPARRAAIRGVALGARPGGPVVHRRHARRAARRGRALPHPRQ